MRWRSLDGEWVAYSVTTGAMSALDAFNATVLESVERGDQTADAVAAALIRDAELPNDPGLAAKVSQVLEQLVTVGLVTTVAE